MLNLRKSFQILPATHRRRIWFVLAIVVLSSIASAATVASIMPFLTVLSDPQRLQGGGVLARVYEWTGFDAPYQFLVLLGVGAVVIIVTASILQILRVYVVWHWTSGVAHTLSCDLLKRILQQPYEFFIKQHSSELTTGVLVECDQAATQYFKPALDAIAAILTILAVLAVVISLNPVVALAALFFLGSVYGVVFSLSRSMMRRLGAIRVAANKERYRAAGEAIQGIKQVKVRSAESFYLRHYDAPSRRIMKGRRITSVVADVPKYVLEVVAFGGVVLLCLLFLDPQAFDQGGGTGELIPLLGAFAIAAQRLLPELQRGFAALTKLQYGAATIEKIRRHIESAPLSGQLPDGSDQPVALTDSLCLEGVRYTYSGAARPSLDDVSLCVRKGERIGIVGSSGAGKSTLVDVLLGLLTPEEGVLRVDGTVIGPNELARWRSSVGYVPQEIFLVDASLAENIAFGVEKKEIDVDRLYQSARLANLMPFIDQDLPDRFETLMGERGVRLSGGQRQRVGIARALYHDADVIVFDEATSALDNVTESELIDAIGGLPGDKTIVIIAHRLSTVRYCGRLVVMERGEVTACGSWDELLETSSVFRSFVERSQVD